ncbi:hypothetical protein DMN91_012778 [Ooceraea biroi]|uniref:Uncharacterized protein n=1 Tax=Ooceraea biroi TaxID=2015173 RepID=A0A3L8D438_OOCBI|nr:uncharacterized protein LOC105283293 [Ooceraea biroi]RLU14891.1 hypothetical protein DMN91_012778 [Ooceraea biroi]
MYLQTLKDVEDIGEDMEYEGMDTWAEYDEDTTEYEDEEEEEEKEEKTEIESEVIEADTLLDYMREFEARRTRELVSKTEEERQQLRHLIGVT